jgi:hypothetical protein
MENWTVLGIFVALSGVIIGAVIALSRSVGQFTTQVKVMSEAMEKATKHLCPYPGGCPLLKQDEATRSLPKG